MATLHDTLTYEPVELGFGTSGLRGLVSDMTDLECYINVAGFLQFLAEDHGLKAGDTVCVAGDLRDSTPRILLAVHQAISDAGYQTVYCGLVPTPTLALYGLQQDAPSVMVTGSHIPSDRNGIKFNKQDGEVLKADEALIQAAVAEVRARLYGQMADESSFTANGMFVQEPAALPEIATAAAAVYMQRYISVFGNQALSGKKIVFYQHSAVGRDMLAELFTQLGAEVVTVGRSDVFIPIDTENVKPADQAYFKEIAGEHPDAFATVSTDGDSDRPFVIDSTGTFHRGDILGAVVAAWCKADAAAYVVSSSDAVDQYLDAHGISYEHTKIGSPYVIVAMQAAAAAGKERVVGWETNGGFLLGAPLELPGGTLAPLPTRDAFFPILVALLAAIENGQSVAELFGTLPARFTQAGLLDDFPPETYAAIRDHFGVDSPEIRQELRQYFTDELSFSDVKAINNLDGVRMTFTNGDIAHIRQSSNAPQLRMYSVAATQERADQIVADAIADPDGIFRRIQADIEG